MRSATALSHLHGMGQRPPGACQTVSPGVALTRVAILAQPNLALRPYEALNTARTTRATRRGRTSGSSFPIPARNRPLSEIDGRPFQAQAPGSQKTDVRKVHPTATHETLRLNAIKNARRSDDIKQAWKRQLGCGSPRLSGTEIRLRSTRHRTGRETPPGVRAPFGARSRRRPAVR